MRPTLRLGFLVLTITLTIAARVDAYDPWDWLDALDGPGPSHGRGNVLVTLFCSGTQESRSPQTGRLFKTVRDSEAESTCLFADLRRFRADADARFHRVDIVVTEIGMSARLHPAVELGLGAGVLRWNGEDPAGTDFQGSRFTVSFPRLVFKPLLAAPVERLRQNADWGFFQIYFRESIIFGTLTEKDFPSKPGTEFSRSYQRVSSMGFIVDAPAALRLLHVLK